MKQEANGEKIRTRLTLGESEPEEGTGVCAPRRRGQTALRHRLGYHAPHEHGTSRWNHARQPRGHCWK
jgi:hypothetical protein